MATILTTTEAANVLHCDEDDPNMLDLLPQVDSHIKNATGHDWVNDDPVIPEAKEAARRLLVRAHEDPGGMASGGVLSLAVAAALAQLSVLALRYKTFRGRDGAGSVSLPGAAPGDSVERLTGKIGASGDQTGAFETVITVEDEIQQVSTADLSACWYQVYLVPVEEL